MFQNYGRRALYVSEIMLILRGSEDNIYHVHLGLVSFCTLSTVSSEIKTAIRELDLIPSDRMVGEAPDNLNSIEGGILSHW
jgi:hypothetical protein